LGPPPWAGRQAIAARVSGAVTFHPEHVPRLLLMAVLLSLLGCIPALGEEIGWAARENGVQQSGFLLTGAVVVVSVLLVVSFRASRGRAPVQVAVTAKEEAVEVTQLRMN
jgi:hypothetical protein